MTEPEQGVVPARVAVLHLGRNGGGPKFTFEIARSLEQAGATVFSVVNTAGTLGGVVMPLLFGMVLDAFTAKAQAAGGLVATTNWGPLFTLLASMYLTSGVCWLLVDCTRTLDRGDDDLA